MDLLQILRMRVEAVQAERGSLTNVSGVFSPTHAASIQWAFGNPLRIRLNFVNPPEPVSIGSPTPLSRLKSAHLVALTAAPSFNRPFPSAFTSLKFFPLIPPP